MNSASKRSSSMAKRIGGEFIVFDDLSHFMHLEKPEPIILAIKGMLQKIRGI